MNPLKQVTLTGRERMHRMLERRDHDRIPRHDGYWEETLERWKNEGLEGGRSAAQHLLQSDVRGVCFNWPTPFPGRREVLSEDAETRVVRNAMGQVVREWKNRSGTPEHIGFGCDTASKWFEEYKPALLQAMATPQIELDKVRKSVLRHQQQNLFCTFNGVEAFEAMRQLVGDELLLPAMLEEPEWVRDMAITYTDLLLRDFQAMLDYGINGDAVWVFGDLGYNHGTFFSPSTYRELLWDQHKRMRDWTHERGMKFIYHTDGDVRRFLDLFVEAGYDCLQPMEAKANMDVRELAPQYGNQLSFFGNIDMTVAIRGDKAELEHEIKTKLAAGMANRGYAYHSDHSVPPQVSLETYRFIVEMVDKYGWYT